MRKAWLAVGIGLLVAVAAGESAAAVRLKDIARVDDGGQLQLVGYGLVVGLGGTGDSRASTFTMQSVGNMLTRLGVTVPEGQVRVKNAAAVMVVARLGRHQRRGSRLDVSVSSLGDARSLEGGVLLYTPLATPDGLVYASAQGSLSVGGFSAGAGGNRVSQNHVLVGRVPGGGTVESEWTPATPADAITILLDEPDYTTARRVATAINKELGLESAQAVDAGTVVLQSPSAADSSDARGARVDLFARIESLPIEPDTAARLVIDERSGTIVAGEHVTIGSVAIAHGNLSVRIEERPAVSQPQPYSFGGRTVVTKETSVAAAADSGAMVAVHESASVGDLARALNALGVSPRDMIAIFQALKEAGALRAELRIL